MAIKALTGLVPEWYTPTMEDEKDEGASSFHCYPLTQPQVLEVQQYYSTERKDFLPMAYAIAYKLGCRGWKNVFDMDGKPLKFNNVTRDKLPAQVLAEVGANIINMSVLGDDEIKN
jgi:hypothetical protein